MTDLVFFSAIPSEFRCILTERISLPSVQGVEMDTALRRRAAGETEIVALILEADCGWKGREFTQFQVLPPGVRAVRSWPRHADAFNKVEQELRLLINKILATRVVGSAGVDNSKRQLKDTRSPARWRDFLRWPK